MRTKGINYKALLIFGAPVILVILSFALTTIKMSTLEQKISALDIQRSELMTQLSIEKKKERDEKYSQYLNKWIHVPDVENDEYLTPFFKLEKIGGLYLTGSQIIIDTTGSIFSVQKAKDKTISEDLFKDATTIEDAFVQEYIDVRYNDFKEKNLK